MSTSSKRFLPLDILRGLSMAFMIIVNNPGSAKYVYPPLEHSAWDGCTPTDVVFPVFLFCMGMAMAFSLQKFGGLNGQAVKKILWRGTAIFMLGLFLNIFPGWDWGSLRYFGVLQRIACCYVLSAVLVLSLRKDKWIWLATGGLLVVYTLIQVLFGQPGAQFTLEGNICGRIDEALIGKAHMYKAYSTALDPCGPIGTLSATANVLLGYLAGSHIKRGLRSETGAPTLTATIFAYGIFSLALAEIAGIWIPVNKALWTASYVLLTNGWAMIALAVIMYIADMKGITKPFQPAIVFGTNALAAYFMSGFFARLIRLTGLKKALAISTPELSLAYAVIYCLLIYAICLAMYRKKIFIKL